PLVWSLAEAAALVGVLIWQVRRRAATADGLLLAVVPLWFAWRSPMNYFAFLPALALVLILSQGWVIARDAPPPLAAHP
nr:hypothetical protein [Ktedonobacterales bacterium]